MTPRERAIGLQRHELLRAFSLSSAAGARGWSLVHLSAFTAHGVYRYGAMRGHVIGTASGWWWALQTEPGVMAAPPVRVAGPVEACREARFAVQSATYRVFEQAKFLRETLADGAGMGDT